MSRFFFAAFYEMGDAILVITNLKRQLVLF